MSSVDNKNVEGTEAGVTQPDAVTSQYAFPRLAKWMIIAIWIIGVPTMLARDYYLSKWAEEEWQNRFEASYHENLAKLDSPAQSGARHADITQIKF